MLRSVPFITETSLESLYVSIPSASCLYVTRMPHNDKRNKFESDNFDCYYHEGGNHRLFFAPPAFPFVACALV